MILLKATFNYLFIFNLLNLFIPLLVFSLLHYSLLNYSVVVPLNTTHQILRETGNKLHHRSSKLPQDIFYQEKWLEIRLIRK